MLDFTFLPDTAKYFNAKLTQFGSSVVYTQKYPFGTSDFRSMLSSAMQRNPDGFMLYSFDTDGAQIVSQAKELGIGVPIMGTDLLDTPTFRATAGSAAEGLWFSGLFTTTDPRQQVQDFDQQYRSKFNRDPDVYSGEGYDCVKLLSEAVRIAGSVDSTKIRDALLQISNYTGTVCGEAINFTTDQDPLPHELIRPHVVVKYVIVNGTPTAQYQYTISDVALLKPWLLT
jgi:branched-chain amino acid transport system substrate-binding protein